MCLYSDKHNHLKYNRRKTMKYHSPQQKREQNRITIVLAVIAGVLLCITAFKKH